MPKFVDLKGTSYSTFQLGIGGAILKSNAGVVEARDAADAAYATVAAALFATFGDDFVLNQGATESGDSWIFTVSRPSTGMTHDLQLVFPAGDPAVGQALTVASFTSNVITLQWTTIAAGTDKVVCDTTTVNYNDASPVAAFTLPIGAVVQMVQGIIKTPWDGSANALSVGYTGSLSIFLPATAIDLTGAAKTIYEYSPGEEALGTTKAIIITHTNTGATAGIARILVFYVIPS